MSLPSLCAQLPDLLPAIERVVLKALAKDPTDHYPTISAFDAAFEQASKKPSLGTTLLTYEHPGDLVNDVAWSPDGTRIFCEASALVAPRNEFEKCQHALLVFVLRSATF